MALTGYTTPINGENIDLLYIFEGYNGVNSTTTGFRKNGVDLSLLLNGWEGGNPNPKATNTSFRVSSGTDIAFQFQKKRTFFLELMFFIRVPKLQFLLSGLLRTTELLLL
jgi:hypothetical protein